MKTDRINTILIVACIALLILGFWYLDSKQIRVAYVKTVTIYEEFDYKRELEKKLDEVKSQRKIILDSMMIKLQMLSNQLQEKKSTDREEIARFQQNRNEYLAKEKQFSEDNQALAEKYSSDIWKHLNQYVREYSNQKKYTYIFGADGSGSLMAAEGGHDITDEVKKFVNDRYNGKTSN